MRRALPIALLLLGLPSIDRADAGAPVRARLATTETVLELEADPAAPKLLRLRGAAGPDWRNEREEPPPASVDMDGTTHPLTWTFDAAASRLERGAVEFVYRSAAPRLTWRWRWRAPLGAGPLEHTVRLENHSGRDLWLSHQPSLLSAWEIGATGTLERFWVEKGADTPSAQGTHLDPVGPHFAWEGRSSTYARPLAGREREMIPYVLVEQAGGPRAGWYVGIEFSGRTRIALRRVGELLSAEAGLDPEPGPYRTRLRADEVFATPTIFLGASAGGPDAAGNSLRAWVRGALNRPITIADPRYPLLVSNSWGAGMAVDERLARGMILRAAALGLEMFHLDAGWFRDVGDWAPDAVKFPHGVAALADLAHRHGLRFGLWMDWTQAGTSARRGARSVDDPQTRDWLIADPPPGWQHREPFKGITFDVGVPAARAWAEGQLQRTITAFHLDMLEHDGYLVAQGSTRADHPAAAPAPGTVRVYEDSGYLWVEGSNSTDVSDHATRAYYAIHEALRRQHPRLLLEVCNDGGRMVDFGSAAHGDYFSITDSYDPLSNRRAFYDSSYVLPPAMLESYVAAWPTPRVENFRYLLRSGMLGWFSLMLDPASWSATQRAEARAQIALYKRALRPLIRSADLYHAGPRPDGVHWDGIEYVTHDGRRGVLYAFRGSGGEAVQRFRLTGLQEAGSYRLRFADHTAPTQVLPGRDLASEGVSVTLMSPLSSELVFFEQIRPPAYRPPP